MGKRRALGTHFCRRTPRPSSAGIHWRSRHRLCKSSRRLRYHRHRWRAEARSKSSPRPSWSGSGCRGPGWTSAWFRKSSSWSACRAEFRSLLSAPTSRPYSTCLQKERNWMIDFNCQRRWSENIESYYREWYTR